MFLASFRVLLPSEYSVPSDGNLSDAIVNVSCKQIVGPALLTQGHMGYKTVSLGPRSWTCPHNPGCSLFPASVGRGFVCVLGLFLLKAAYVSCGEAANSQVPLGAHYLCLSLSPSTQKVTCSPFKV